MFCFIGLFCSWWTCGPQGYVCHNMILSEVSPLSDLRSLYNPPKSKIWMTLHAGLNLMMLLHISDSSLDVEYVKYLHQQDSKICQFYPSDTRKSRYFCPKYWKGRVFSVNCQILCNSASLNSTYYTERVTFCINSWNFYLSYSSLLWIDADIRMQ